MSSPKIREEVANWLYFAEEDLASARIMAREKVFNKTCFHSQQAAEKSLKAFLLQQNREIVKTHKIVDLLNYCREINGMFKKFKDQAGVLDLFYLPTRYPDAVVGSLPEGLPKQAQAEEALNIAKEIVEFVNGALLA